MIDPPSSPVPGNLGLLVREEGDDVAVAVRDVDHGNADGAYLTSGVRFEIKVRAFNPLGQRVALRDLAGEDRLNEYGVPIGVTRCSICPGDLVHTHNLRSAR